MASRSALFLAMLFISTMSSANSLVIQNLNIKMVTILGNVVCEAPASTTPQPPQPVAGSYVVLSCGSSQTEVTRAVAEAKAGGFFTLIMKVMGSPGFDLAKCNVIARFPLGQCVYFPNVTALTSALEFVSVVREPNLFGNAFFRANSFSV